MVTAPLWSGWLGFPISCATGSWVKLSYCQVMALNFRECTCYRWRRSRSGKYATDRKSFWYGQTVDEYCKAFRGKTRNLRVMVRPLWNIELVAHSPWRFSGTWSSFVAWIGSGGANMIDCRTREADMWLASSWRDLSTISAAR